MKIRLFLLLSLVLAGSLSLAAVANAPDHVVVQSVLDANTRLTEAANRLDTEGFFADIVDSDETRIIQNGKLFQTRAEAMAAVRLGSQGVARLERRFLAPHVTLLAPDTALLTAEGTTAVTFADGRTNASRFAVSLIFGLRDGRWLLLHGHYSQPN